jgi:nitrite reductase/ring-hydroxylating ferredoxin subunit
MERIQTGDELERCPFPIPLGWYAVDHTDQLARGEVREIQAFDKEWVLFRGNDGSVGMTDAYCPHLGAHLAKGGTVVGNNIRCPFHHWQYDTKGWCKEVPYGKRMPAIARQQPVLQALPVQEKLGFIWVWYHPAGEEPSFEVPIDLPELTDSETYIEPRRGEWDIGTCLQEIGENNADNAHLQFLHGSPEIPPVEVSDEGHIWNVKLGSDERGIVGQNVGPGIQIYRHVRGEISMLMFSAPLPITRELTRVRMLFSFKNYAEGTPERLEAEQIYQHSIGEAEGEEGAGFESVDLIVWDNKKYRPRPLLCDGDGPIAAWRKYYQQFYAEPSKAPA